MYVKIVQFESTNSSRCFWRKFCRRRETAEKSVSIYCHQKYSASVLGPFARNCNKVDKAHWNTNLIFSYEIRSNTNSNSWNWKVLAYLKYNPYYWLIAILILRKTIGKLKKILSIWILLLAFFLDIISSFLLVFFNVVSWKCFDGCCSSHHRTKRVRWTYSCGCASVLLWYQDVKNFYIKKFLTRTERNSNFYFVPK